MSSILDVPAHLAMLLALAAAPASEAKAETSGEVKQLTVAVREGITIGSGSQRLRFREQVWLRAVRNACGRDRQNPYSDRIFVTSSGHYYVPSTAERTEIMALQRDAAVASEIVRASAENNAGTIRTALHRDATIADLYIAHVAGPELAIRLSVLAKDRPYNDAARELPQLLAIVPEAFAQSGKSAAAARVSDVYRRVARAVRPKAGTYAAPARSGADENVAFNGAVEDRAGSDTGVIFAGRGLANLTLLGD